MVRFVHVGETLEGVGAHSNLVWRRMTCGEAVTERHVGFADWETMVRALWPKGLEIL